MLIIEKEDRRLLVLNEKNDELLNFNTLVVAGSGKGKTLMLEKIISSAYKKGYNVICVMDAKNLLELGFMCFPPEIMKDYHINLLKKYGFEKISLSIRLIHPFSFDIPLKNIPPTLFVTIPIPDLGDSEFDFLLENEEDKVNRELLLNTKSELNKNDGLWEFMQKLEKETERKVYKEEDRLIRLKDANRMGLKGIKSGDIKNIDSLYTIFKRFQKHYFLAPKSFKYNINFEKDVFSDQSIVKIFTTRYIKDQKTRDFFTLYIINQIVEQSHKSKHPILIVMDELKEVCSSFYKKGYKKVLSREISRHLNTSFRVRNISSVSSSQSFSALSRELLKSNAFTSTYIGYIDSDTDLDILKTIYGYKPETISLIQGLGMNEFIARGVKDFVVEEEKFIKILPPDFPHCEPAYNFDYFYGKYFPERMKNYSHMVNEMKVMIDEQENSIKRLNEQTINKIKEASKEKKKIEKVEAELKEIKDEKNIEKQDKIDERNINIWNDRNLSSRKLAKKYGLSHTRIIKIIKEMEAKQNGRDKKSDVKSERTDEFQGTETLESEIKEESP